MVTNIGLDPVDGARVDKHHLSLVLGESVDWDFVLVELLQHWPP